jgi:hypothetical protein
MVRYTRQRLRFTQPRIPTLSHQTLIERCPSCGRAFTNGAAVLRHLNNPRSSCTHASFPPKDTNSQSPQPHERPLPDFLTPDWIDDEPSPNNSPSATSAPFCDVFPGASATFGQGDTFFNRFDQDQHASKRQENPYYPFASAAEWELAVFLHRSGLSTRDIDSFFSLQIVCFLYIKS